MRQTEIFRHLDALEAIAKHWSQVKHVSQLSKRLWEEIERKTGQNLAVYLEREQ